VSNFPRAMRLALLAETRSGKNEPARQACNFYPVFILVAPNSVDWLLFVPSRPRLTRARPQRSIPPLPPACFRFFVNASPPAARSRCVLGASRVGCSRFYYSGGEDVCGRAINMSGAVYRRNSARCIYPGGLALSDMLIAQFAAMSKNERCS